jgi:hypothetical protein
MGRETPDIQKLGNALHSAFEWHRPVFLTYPKSCNRNVDLNARGFRNIRHLVRQKKLPKAKRFIFSDWEI